MLYVPFAVGALVGWRSPLRLLLLALSMTFIFVARESLLEWWRARSRGLWDHEALRLSAMYLLLGGVFGMPLLLIYRLSWFIAIGSIAAMSLALNSWQAVHRKDRTIVGEMVAIAGLTLTAPASFYAARGQFDSTALWLWALCAVYFASSVFYVKFRVTTINPRHDHIRLESRRRCALYHGFLLALLLVLTLTGDLSAVGFIAFVPIMTRSFWHVAKPVRKINLQRIGWLEMAYSLVFLIFTTLNFRL
jgi:YwiC-like protein